MSAEVKERKVIECDERLRKMGNYFVYYNLHERYGWTFEEFMDKLERGVFDGKGIKE